MQIRVGLLLVCAVMAGRSSAQVLTPPIPDDVDLYQLPLDESANGGDIPRPVFSDFVEVPAAADASAEDVSGPVSSADLRSAHPPSANLPAVDRAAVNLPAVEGLPTLSPNAEAIPQSPPLLTPPLSGRPMDAAPSGPSMSGSPMEGPPRGGRSITPGRLQRYGYSTPIRAQFFAGDNYAEPTSFLSLEMLRPLSNRLFADGSEQIQYFDGRFGISTDGGGFLGNFGLGQRAYFASTDTIADLNLWYDFDKTSDRIFHQVTGGGQIQNANLLFRGHYYLPVGTDEKFTRFTGLTGNTAFTGNSLALERFRLEERAFQGFDLELGLILPWDEASSRWYLGYYNFEADDAAAVKGWSSTLTVEPVPRLTLGFQVTVDDETDDADYLFTCSYDFYHGPRDNAPTIRHRLGESVRRNHHMVTRGSAIYDPLLAEDASGTVFNFVHVSSAGGGAGTAESPYTLLSQAAADATATPGTMILAHADSVFTGQSIVLPANTRLLGEGVDHSLATAATQLGDITLPRVTSGTALPVLSNAPATGPAITLASAAEVNGFRIQNAGGSAIFGTGATTDARVLNTSIDGASIGVELSQYSGSYTFDAVSVANTTAAGILLDRGTPTSSVGFESALAISDTGSHGIHFQQMQDDSTTTFASTVTITRAGGDGILFDDNGDSTKATFSGRVSVVDPTGSGLVVSNLTTMGVNTTPDILFPAGLTVSSPGVDGVQIDQDNSNIELQSLAVTDWTRSALAIDGASGSLVVTEPLNLVNATGSLSSTLQIINSSGAFTFADVSITDTARAAIGAPTVFLSENTTGLNDISFARLDVQAGNGIALFGQDLGATVSKLVIADGVISSVNGSAISLTRMSTDVTLTSVSAASTLIGINLDRIGQVNAFHDGFTITGDGLTAGSGGLLTGVNQGTLINAAQDVSLALLDVRSTVAGVAVQAVGTSQPENLTLDRLTLDGGAAAGWVGLDVAWSNGAHFGDPNVFSGNTILGAGASQIGMRLQNTQSNPEMLATLSGNVINLTGASSDGILLTAQGFGAGQVANFGGIRLSGTQNNLITVPGSPFVATELDGATIDGSILVNGLPMP